MYASRPSPSVIRLFIVKEKKMKPIATKQSEGGGVTVGVTVTKHTRLQLVATVKIRTT